MQAKPVSTDTKQEEKMSDRGAEDVGKEGAISSGRVVGVSVPCLGTKWDGPSMDRLRQEGLGKGVDATKPHVLLHTQIEPTKKNLTKQTVGSGYQEFKETLETMSSVKNHLYSSLGLEVAQMVTFKFGFEIQREQTSTTRMTGCGKQILKETVLFNTNKISNSSIHVVDLLKSAASERRRKYSPGSDIPRQERDLICKEVIRNRNGGVTHYISSIDLGAKVYAVSTEQEDTHGGKRSVTGEIGGGMAGLMGKASVDFSKETMQKSKASEERIYFVIDPGVELKEEHTEIAANQEKMIAYQVTPLWYLVQDEDWRLSVKKACKDYVDEFTPLAVGPGDPFLMKVGANNTSEYLKVANNRVEGTVAKTDAHHFTLDFPQVHWPDAETDGGEREKLENPNFGFYLCHQADGGQQLFVTARKGHEVLVPHPTTGTEEQGTFYLEHPANRKPEAISKWQNGKGCLLVRRQTRTVLRFWTKITEFYLVLEREADGGPLVLKEKQSLDEADSYVQFYIEKP